MDMFDRLKDSPLLTDYFDRSKEKIIGKSSKFVYDIGKIHLYITGEIGLDLHNLLHESIHYALAKSSLFIQMKDLLLTFDFISFFTEDLNVLPFRAKNDQIEFALDLLSGDRPFRCKRYKELCLVYFTYHKLFVRSKILQRNAIICNEGAVTYCALHIQEYSKKSVLDYLFNTLVPPKYVNDLYLAQKRLIKKIDDLSVDNPYRVGYQYAKKLAKDFGIESVIIATMLSNYVPFYNFDLLHDDEIFESRTNYLYNADERFKYLLSLSPTKKKMIFDCVNEQREKDFVLQMLNKQERPERKLDFVYADMYYLYYLILHRKIINVISYIVDEDMENKIVNMVRSNVVPVPSSIDESLYYICNPNCLAECLKGDQLLQYHALG